MLNFKFGWYHGANPKHTEDSQGKGKESSGEKLGQWSFFFCLGFFKFCLLFLMWENNEGRHDEVREQG